MNIIQNYKNQVSPKLSDSKWIDTRADKETRYYNFKANMSLDQLERFSIDIIKLALSNSKNPSLSCSFGVDSMLQLHLTLLAMDELKIPRSTLNVVWNDTKNEFKEVRDFAKREIDRLDLNMIITSPKKPLKKIIDDNGGIDSSYFTSRKGKRSNGIPLSEKCCNTLKHEPMNRVKKEHNFDLMIVGLRADESNQRLLAGLRDGEYFYSSGTWKSLVCRPILWWKEKDVWDYVFKNNIPYNSLYDKNLITEYSPKHLDHIPFIDLNDLELNISFIEKQQKNFTKKQQMFLSKLGYKFFTPRTGCQMCPIPVKYGYMHFMRENYPKVYNAMVYNLGYGKALLDLVPEDVKIELKELFNIDLDEHNAHEHLKEILESKPCVFDRLEENKPIQKETTAMSRTIKKQIIESTVRTATIGIDKNGKPTLTELPVQIHVGKVSRPQIEKQLKKDGHTGVVILDIETSHKTYMMDISEFVKYGREVTE